MLGLGAHLVESLSQTPFEAKFTQIEPTKRRSMRPTPWSLPPFLPLTSARALPGSLHAPTADLHHKTGAGSISASAKRLGHELPTSCLQIPVSDVFETSFGNRT